MKIKPQRAFALALMGSQGAWAAAFNSSQTSFTPFTMAEVGGAGEKQLKAVLDKLTAPDTTRKWFEPGACFAAGTLVHTKEGLVPIEQIKVGDYVLSKHDSGTGEQAYKRVLQTFYHPAETVIEVRHAHPNKPNTGKRIICTPNHPIWVAEVRSEDDQPGWTAANRLSNSWSGGGPNLS